jgi:hypothetical protein
MDNHQSIPQFACFISRTTQLISVNSGIVSLHKILLGRFNFVTHQFTMTTTLHKMRIKNVSETAHFTKEIGM